MKALNFLKKHSAKITLLFLLIQLFAFGAFVNEINDDIKKFNGLISKAYELKSLDTAIQSLKSGQDRPMKLLNIKTGAELDIAFKKTELELNNSINHYKKNKWLLVGLVLLILFANAIAGRYVIKDIVSKRKLQSIS
jgi:hypothetical protein